MPKIRCVCNYVIGLGEIPSPNILKIISDDEFEKFTEGASAEEVYSAMNMIVCCSNCGRLHIFWNGTDQPQTIYKPEE